MESLLCEHLDRVGVDLEDFLLACDAVSKKEQGIGQQVCGSCHSYDQTVIGDGPCM